MSKVAFDQDSVAAEAGAKEAGAAESVAAEAAFLSSQLMVSPTAWRSHQRLMFHSRMSLLSCFRSLLLLGL